MKAAAGTETDSEQTHILLRELQMCLLNTCKLTYPLLYHEIWLFQTTQMYTVMLFACSGGYPPHAMATVRPRIANDDQKDGNVSTLSGVAAEVVCVTQLSSSAPFKHDTQVSISKIARHST